MIYEYKCKNTDCKDADVVKVVVKTMKEFNKSEICEICEHSMQKVFSLGGIKTADGIK